MKAISFIGNLPSIMSQYRLLLNSGVSVVATALHCDSSYTFIVTYIEP
jgi:hypothetical protein